MSGGPTLEETAARDLDQHLDFRLRWRLIQIVNQAVARVAYPGKDDMKIGPFRELDNFWMTPQTSACTTGMVDRRWREIADNPDRVARGAPLRYQLK